VLGVLARFGVFAAVPTEGDISYADLATKVPLTERQVRRAIRHAMTKNIFHETRPDHVAHTALSMAVVKAPSLVPWFNHNLGEILPASSRLADTIEKYGDPQNPEDVALGLAWNWDKDTSLFSWFANDGEGEKKGWRARQFAQAMAAMDGGSHDTRHTVEAFDWASLGSGTLVDVGGDSYQ
jgi:6-hydroxytryprostatin B O-methyltransferase